ncbi:MAG: L,D-transpeptidase family protein [Stellaceae bacterium]
MREKVMTGLLAALLLLGGASFARAATFDLEPGQTMVGSIGGYTTKYQDTLLDLARTYDLGYTQLVIANPGIHPWVPGAGERVVIPALYILPDAQHRGIVINLAQQRLFYYPPGGGTVMTFPIGVGVTGWKTPVGATRVVQKVPHPAWYPPASIKAQEPDLPNVIPAGPDNPLGQWALRLGWKNYLIHGTNKPYGVGRSVSHGCIRLYPKDIDPLFHAVKVGIPVHVVNQHVEAAWYHGVLYVAVFPTKEQMDEIDIEQRPPAKEPPNLIARVTAIAGDHASEVNWPMVKALGLIRNGVPTPVTPPVSSVGTTIPDPVSATRSSEIAPAE